MVPGALLVVVAAVGFWPFSAGARRPASREPLPAAAAPGHILVQTQDGYLALADPDGGHYTRLNVPGLQPESQVAPDLAPDDRYLTTLSQVIGIRSGRPAAARDPNIDVSTIVPAYPGAFADHDRVLLAVAGYYRYVGADAAITAYDTATRGQTSLGSGDNVAGDPAAVGAFVSVAAPVEASTVPKASLHPDARIELRDAAHRPIVLATARALNQVLGQAPGVQAELVPYPDQSGDKVAVQVDLLTGGGLTGGVVVLNRAGRVLGSILSAFGPVLSQPVVWSPDGRSLAFPNTGTGGPELITWTIGA